MSLYHQILGINENDSIEVIKEHYRSLCKKYHPDISNDESIGKMAMINEAYNALVKANNNLPKIFNTVLYPNSTNQISIHKDPAYVFYKQGITFYRQIPPNYRFSKIDEWIDSKYVFANVHNVKLAQKIFLKALYYFNIICTQYEDCVWYFDSIENIVEINRKLVLLRNWIKNNS
jgi:hypothetical protein